MQISRSVIIPTTRACSFNTGTHPQSWSHISCAAVARVSDVKHVLTFVVMKSLIFTVIHLMPAERVPTELEQLWYSPQLPSIEELDSQVSLPCAFCPILKCSFH